MNKNIFQPLLRRLQKTHQKRRLHLLKMTVVMAVMVVTVVTEENRPTI